MNHLLFATDGSQTAMKAGDTVKTLLQAWPDAQLTIVHVTAIAGYPYEVMTDALERALNEEATQIERDVLDVHFAQWKDRIHFRSLTGRPGTVICQAAAEAKADLIVVGSHGKGALERTFLGSVSEEVLHLSPVPVLIARL